jgi:hypothetical protein
VVLTDPSLRAVLETFWKRERRAGVSDAGSAALRIGRLVGPRRACRGRAR